MGSGHGRWPVTCPGIVVFRARRNRSAPSSAGLVLRVLVNDPRGGSFRRPA